MSLPAQPLARVDLGKERRTATASSSSASISAATSAAVGDGQPFPILTAAD
jgi:hypothetical protein